MIHWLPLEPLEQRYTAQMDRWVRGAMDHYGVQYTSYGGGGGYDTIDHGQWLDTIQSSLWKYGQCAALTKAIQRGEVKNGDTVLVGDVWFAGIEGIKYQTDLLGLKVKYAGWHYAGCFDPFDLLNRSLGNWGRKYEAALLEGVFDDVCFGSPFHYDFVARSVNLKSPPHIYGLCWNHDDVACYASDHKERIVAFTHRWANEKRWWEFVHLAQTLRERTGWRFVYSSNATPPLAISGVCQQNGIEVVVHASKADYYKWLGKVGIVWSGADQETFGYSFMEAVALGARVVAPMRCAYPDHFKRVGLYPEQYLYAESDPCGAVALRCAMNAHDSGLEYGIVPTAVSKHYTNSAERFIGMLA